MVQEVRQTRNSREDIGIKGVEQFEELQKSVQAETGYTDLYRILVVEQGRNCQNGSHLQGYGP